MKKSYEDHIAEGVAKQKALGLYVEPEKPKKAPAKKKAAPRKRAAAKKS
jgi:hypothetical protein